MDISIRIEKNGHGIVVKASQSIPLVETLVKEKFPVGNSCGGFGTCGTCRIIILEGASKLGSPNELEQEMIDMRGFSNGERLSCQIYPVDGMKIQVPD